MKPLLPVLVLLFISFSSLAQIQTVPVFCRLQYNGRVEYGYLRSCLAEIIPDSARDAMLIDPRKQYHITTLTDALQLMILSGWKLTASDETIGGSGGNVYSSTSYLLTRDVRLDEKDRALFLERLKTAYH
jgi:hypothetical protein